MDKLRHVSATALKPTTNDENHWFPEANFVLGSNPTLSVLIAWALEQISGPLTLDKYGRVEDRLNRTGIQVKMNQASAHTL